MCILSENSYVFVKDGMVKARAVRVGKMFKMIIRVKLPEDKVLVGKLKFSRKDSLQFWHSGTSK